MKLARNPIEARNCINYTQLGSPVSPERYGLYSPEEAPDQLCVGGMIDRITRYHSQMENQSIAKRNAALSWMAASGVGLCSGATLMLASHALAGQVSGALLLLGAGAAVLPAVTNWTASKNLQNQSQKAVQDLTRVESQANQRAESLVTAGPGPNEITDRRHWNSGLLQEISTVHDAQTGKELRIEGLVNGPRQVRFSAVHHNNTLQLEDPTGTRITRQVGAELVLTKDLATSGIWGPGLSPGTQMAQLVGAEQVSTTSSTISGTYPALSDTRRVFASASLAESVEGRGGASLYLTGMERHPLTETISSDGTVLYKSDILGSPIAFAGDRELGRDRQSTLAWKDGRLCSTQSSKNLVLLNPLLPLNSESARVEPGTFFSERGPFTNKPGQLFQFQDAVPLEPGETMMIRPKTSRFIGSQFHLEPWIFDGLDCKYDQLSGTLEVKSQAGYVFRADNIEAGDQDNEFTRKNGDQKITQYINVGQVTMRACSGPVSYNINHSGKSHPFAWKATRFHGLRPDQLDKVQLEMLESGNYAIQDGHRTVEVQPLVPLSVLASGANAIQGASNQLF